MLETNCSLLQDIHSELQNPENENLSIVSGSYDYYHYKIDGTNDVGWGCGYRTLQSICSWLKRVTGKSSQTEGIPSVRKIQEILVEIGDKDPAFIDSKSWIGTFEAFLVLDHLFDVPCKVIHLERGELFGKKLTFLIEHFQKFKSPVMMGGDVDNASKCIMGISYDKNDDEKEHGFNNTHLLVVDPHFYGKIATKKQLQCDGWVCWKKLMVIMTNPMRKEVVNLYKQLLFLGREYPLGGDYFKKKLKGAFLKNKDVTDPETIKKLIDRGNYVIKELEALYMLRKYRTLKKRYYEENN